MKTLLNKIIEFIKQMLTSGSGVSSKRVSGFIGWIAFIVIVSYCTVNRIQAPTITDTLAVCSTALLGLETITNIWTKRS